MSTIYNIMLCFFLDPNVFIHFLYYNNRQQISYDHGFLMKYSIFVGYHSQCLIGCGQKERQGKCTSGLSRSCQCVEGHQRPYLKNKTIVKFSFVSRVICESICSCSKKQSTKIEGKLFFLSK